MQEVSEFIVVAPSTRGKAIAWAEQRLLAFLEGHFPFYTFRVEPFGPLSDEDDFTVVPIMNRRPDPDEPAEDDRFYMCKPLDPNVIPQIKQALREFDLLASAVH